MWRKRKPPAWLRLKTNDWCVLTAGTVLWTFLMFRGTLRLMGWIGPIDPGELVIEDARPYAVIFGLSTIYFVWLSVRLLLYTLFFADDVDQKARVDE